MTKQIIIYLFFIALIIMPFNLVCQTKLDKKSFFIGAQKDDLPEDYINLISRRCGWIEVGTYYFDSDSIAIVKKEKGVSYGVSEFGPFEYDHGDYTRIAGDSIYSLINGKKGIIKIIHIDKKFLVIEMLIQLPNYQYTAEQKWALVRVLYKKSNC